jgi:protein involved in polysaccharide export with SLBB domain
MTIPPDIFNTGSLHAPTNPVYVIGPGDVLDIRIWKEPGVSGVVRPRPDGRISLPLVNNVQASGLSPEQLAAVVTERLEEFLNESKITAIITAINSQRVFVVGELLQVGAFPLITGTIVCERFQARAVKRAPSDRTSGPPVLTARQAAGQILTPRSALSRKMPF